MLTLGILAALELFQVPKITCSGYVPENKPPILEPAVCPCEYNFLPVCGSNGIMYQNQCLLDCYNESNEKKGLPLVVETFGGCYDYACQDLDLPVCTLDGITYPNECELASENNRRIKKNQPIVYLAYRKACNGPPCPCDTIASPVCGSDNVLYRNLCVLNGASTNAVAVGLSPIEFKNVGTCLDGCLCPDIKEPLCGSDGNKYDNLCQIACQNRRMTCSLSPPVKPDPSKACLPCECPDSYKPVCAYDGVLPPRTFPNNCEVTCEAKRQNNPFLYPIGYGVCPKCFCNSIDLPVCGTDCKTYRNECELRCENERNMGTPRISVFHSGPCNLQNCICNHCPPEYEPVCGSDKLSYWNMCWLDCNSDCNQKQALPKISLAAKGTCEC